MTKEQAFQIIDNALSQLQVTRQIHHNLMNALKVLMEPEIKKEIKDNNDIPKTNT